MKKYNKKIVVKKKTKNNKFMMDMDIEEPSKIVEKIKNTQLIFSMENMRGTIITTKDEKVKIDSYDEYLKLKKESNSLREQNKNYQYAIEKSRFLFNNNTFLIEKICKYYTNNEKYGIIYAKSNKFLDNSFSKSEKINSNYVLLFDDSFYGKEYKGDNTEKKIKLYNDILIHFLYYLKMNIDKNNNILLYINILNEKTIPIIQLYSLFFEKIIIFGGILLIGISYKKDNNFDDILLKIIKNNNIFSIDDKNNTINKDLFKYINNINKIYISMYKEFIKTKDENSYVLARYYFNFYLIKSMGIQYEKELIDELSLFYVNLFKLKIYSKDDIKKIEANINTREGTYISNIIKKNNYKKCFEVGLAHGISSIYILKNFGTSLISIDPFQKSQWDNQALKFIKHLGYDKNHSLIEKKSHVALPKMLEKYGEDSFDFSFIDGDHKFDVTLLDFYYSSLLVRIGGTIIIDDALHAGVSKCIKFIDTNMSNFKKLESPNTIAVYKKVGEDKREWFYHKNF